MLLPRLTNCPECASIPSLLANIDCKLNQLASALYNNTIFALNQPISAVTMLDLLNYKRILTYRVCNPNYAGLYSLNMIASRVIILTGNCKTKCGGASQQYVPVHTTTTSTSCIPRTTTTTSSSSTTTSTTTHTPTTTTTSTSTSTSTTTTTTTATPTTTTTTTTAIPTTTTTTTATPTTTTTSSTTTTTTTAVPTTTTTTTLPTNPMNELLLTGTTPTTASWESDNHMYYATERGFCWNTTGYPTTLDAIQMANVPTGMGIFSATCTPVAPGGYYWKAYCIIGGVTYYYPYPGSIGFPQSV